jgi:hypothetical protein
MAHRLPFLRGAAAAALVALGCSNAGENRVTGLSGSGVVDGYVIVDANGSRAIDAGDDSLAGATVRLVLSGRADLGLVRTTGAGGFFRFGGVPVGVYALQLDTAALGDTLHIVKVDSGSFTVGASDSVRVNILVGLPLLTVRQARADSVGRRVFVTGVVLAGSATFADTTTSITDSSGTIRVVRPRTAFAVGDSVRLLGTLGTRAGEPPLDDPSVFAVGPGHLPAAAVATTAVAAAASGGDLDARLVAVHTAVVTDTSRTLSTFALTVNDGSGPLVVGLDRTADAAFQTANLPGLFVPGNRFDVQGVLLPTGTGTWQLHPRSAADLTLIPFPVVSIAAARLLPVGQTAVVIGVALNSSPTFSDSSVFLADTSGAIRLTRLRTSVTAGDSVRVQATTATRSGEPTLDGGTSVKLGTGFYPPAATLTTAVAATAQGGARDAQLVVVPNATVSDTATVLGDFRLTVSDGSGALQVLLDHAAAFIVPGVYLPGATFNIAGVLVPTGTGTWVLKPRGPTDLVKH